MSDIDGRVLALTATFQHLMQCLEDKGILPCAEREQIIGDMYRYMDRNPDLAADPEAYHAAVRTIGMLEPISAG